MTQLTRTYDMTGDGSLASSPAADSLPHTARIYTIAAKQFRHCTHHDDIAVFILKNQHY